MRLLFGAHLKIGAATTGCSQIVVCSLQRQSLHHRVRQSLTLFYNSTALRALSLVFLPAHRNSLSICCKNVSIFKFGTRCYPSLGFPIRFSLFIYVLFFSTVSKSTSKSCLQKKKHNQPGSLAILHSLDFLFLAMSWSFRVRFLSFFTRDVHTAVFLPIFVI